MAWVDSVAEVTTVVRRLPHPPPRPVSTQARTARRVNETGAQEGRRRVSSPIGHADAQATNQTSTNVIRRGDVANRMHDPKVETLRAERSPNPRPQDVSDEAFAASEFFDPGPGPGQVRDGAPGPGRRCRRSAAVFRLSRPSFYQAAGALRPTACPGRCRPGRDLDGRTSSPRRWSRLAAAARAEDPSVRSGDVAGRSRRPWGPGASTVGGAGADAGEEPQQWRPRMTAAPTTAAADVERYEQLRRRALAGDAPWPPGWPRCSSTAWRPGYAPGAPWAYPARRGLRRRDQPVPLRPRLTGWSSRRPRWRWARWQG